MHNSSPVNDKKYNFIEVAESKELQPGERLFIEIEGLPIAVFNVEGQIYAIGDICTHDNGPLGDGELDGDQIICPRHGARFELQSGRALGLPAVVNVPSYPSRIENGKIYLGLPVDT